MKKWFIEILEGRKVEEYREIKPYWTKRLFEENGSPRHYDIIVFRNGYAKDAPMMKVEFKGVKDGEFMGKEVYAIQLGKILETENCERLWKLEKELKK